MGNGLFEVVKDLGFWAVLAIAVMIIGALALVVLVIAVSA